MFQLQTNRCDIIKCGLNNNDDDDDVMRRDIASSETDQVRSQIIRDMLSSERDYVKHLHDVIEVAFICKMYLFLTNERLWCASHVMQCNAIELTIFRQQSMFKFTRVYSMLNE